MRETGLILPHDAPRRIERILTGAVMVASRFHDLQMRHEEDRLLIHHM